MQYQINIKMKVTGILIFSLFFLTITLPLKSQNADLFFKASGSPADPKVKASWNRYYTYEGITELCRQLQRSIPVW